MCGATEKPSRPNAFAVAVVREKPIVLAFVFNE
jgi:hypothetical protein